jgi:hypothetical protein
MHDHEAVMQAAWIGSPQMDDTKCDMELMRLRDDRGMMTLKGLGRDPKHKKS